MADDQPGSVEKTKYGYEPGDTCRRSGCTGVLAEQPVENCSCHISPPCAQCTEDRTFCPECGYEAKYDTQFNEFIVNTAGKNGAYRCWEPRPLDATKIDWRIRPHTHFTQVCEGCYPPGTSRKEVESRVVGTFGGRFESFGGGRFRYIAYTD